jgi:hypothetical protein
MEGKTKYIMTVGLNAFVLEWSVIIYGMSAGHTSKMSAEIHVWPTHVLLRIEALQGEKLALRIVH